MDVTKFLSAHTYVVLPVISNPRVYLAIDSGKIARRSLQLYNPFSIKAKLLKLVIKALSVYLNAFGKLLLPTVKGTHTHLMDFIEQKIGKKLVGSLYIATAKDKIVLQLQDSNGIYGYLKFPISAVGEQRLLNERNAIQKLSAKNMLPELKLSASYEGTPFIILENLQGSIGELARKDYEPILDGLKKNKKFRLSQHPRILQLKNRAIRSNLQNLSQLLEKTMKTSAHEYYEVYEHGDFAPWNLMQTENGIIPFDLEYFEENGLEHLDRLKYHFQIAHLLQHKKGKNLIDAIKSDMAIVEFKPLFQIFLLKEIINKHEANEQYDHETELLALL